MHMSGSILASVAARPPEQLVFDLAPTRAPGAVHLELGVALELRDAREATAPPAPTVASLREGARHAAALGLADRSPSLAAITAAGEALADLPAHPEEIAALFGCSRSVAGEVVRFLSERTGYSRREPTRVDGGDQDCDADLVRAALPVAARTLDDTLLDPQVGGYKPPLQVASVVRAGALPSGILAAAATVEIVLLRRAEPDVPTLPIVADWEGLAELVDVAGVDPLDAHAMGEAAGRYARRELLPEHAPAIRRRVLGRLRALRNHVVRYRAEFPEHGDALMAIIPPLPVLGDGDRLAVERFRKNHSISCRRNRKSVARAISRDLDGGIAAALVAVSAARSLSDACMRAEAIMREEAVTGPFDFGYDARVVLPDGRWGLEAETNHLRARWRPELRAELDAGGAVQQALALGLDRPAVRFDARSTPIEFQFMRAECCAEEADTGSGDGGRVGGHVFDGRDREHPSVGYVPHVFRHFADCVFLSPAGLRESLVQRRLDRIVAEDLPFPRYRPAGLVGPDGAEQAALHRDAANAGMVMICPHALLHGLLFALACALTVVMSFARAGEARQIVHDVAGWTVRGQGVLAADAFYAIPKGQAKPRAFKVAPLGMRALGVLVQFGLAREGDAELPMCEPGRDLGRKCVAGRYVFAFRGEMLSVADLNYLLAVLFAGVARVRTHDLRHAAAARASEEGATDESIAAWMNVEGWCVRGYATDEFAEPDDEVEVDEAELGQLEWFSARTDAMVIAGTLEAMAA